MPLYRYKALGHQGEMLQGYITGNTQSEALSKLYKAQIELIKPVELESMISIESIAYEPDDEVIIKLTIQNKSPYQVKLNKIDIKVPHSTKAKTANIWQDEIVSANSAITKEFVIKILYPLLC